MSPFKHMQDEALDLGRRNAEAMDLVRMHCSNARIERSPFGGFGLLEQMTGLPIGMHTVACEHAAKPPSFAAAEFLKVALSFYANNCVGCPQRVLVGIPNLAMVAAEVGAKGRAEEERRARARQEAGSAREARHRGREQRAMNESEPTRELVRLVNL